MPDLIPTDTDPFSYTATPVDYNPFPQQPQQPTYPAGSAQSLVSSAASQYNLDPNLFLRQANQESGFNQRSTSSAGAIGVMQLMPGTARQLGVDPYDVGQNIQGGAQYMRQMLDRYNGDYSLALAAYNAGPGRVDAYVRNGTPLPAETQHYVATIMGGQGAPAYRASATPATNPAVYGPDVAAYQQYVAAHPGGPDYVAPGQGVLAMANGVQPASPTVPEIDPFAAAGAAETAGNQWLGGVFGNMARGLLDIPRQAFGASNELQATAASPQPQYNPAPVLNAAGLAMTGGFAGVPLRAGETALGAGPVRTLAAPAIRDPNAPLFDYSRLAEVPDVPQYNLERYVPKRGVPEATQALADPANVKRVNAIAKQGAQMGGVEWYNTDPLRQSFVEELGSDAGQRAYQRYLDYVAATSPRSNVGTNARNASYYYTLEQQGEPLPARMKVGNNWTVAEPLPQPYGHIAQALHIQNAENIRNAGGWPVLQNPKPASFAQNLAGNQMPVTIDTHNARLWGLAGDLPKPNEYGFMEQLQQKQAKKLGMTPAQYQAAAWLGGGEETGLRSTADPFLKVFEDRVAKTADRTGKTKAQVLTDFIKGRQSLYSVGGAAGAGAALEDQRR